MYRCILTHIQVANKNKILPPRFRGRNPVAGLYFRQGYGLWARTGWPPARQKSSVWQQGPGKVMVYSRQRYGLSDTALLLLFLQRPTTTRRQSDSTRRVSGIDIARQLENWQGASDERLWKMIVSPEFGDRIDLSRLTRDLVRQMEKDLGTDLEWVAVEHHNTEHPHVHVVIRGIRSDRRVVTFEPGLREAWNSWYCGRPLHAAARVSYGT